MIIAFFIGLQPFKAFGDLDIEDWLRQAEGSYSKSPQFLSSSKASEAAKKQAKLTEFESPWTFSTQVQDTSHEQNPELSLTPHPTNTFDSQLGLDYRLRSSFEISLDATYDQVKYQEPLSAPYRTPDGPYNAALRFSYDVLKGGSNSLENTTAKSAYYSARRTLFVAQNEQLQTRVQLINLFVDIFVTECKIRELKKAQEFVGEAVKTGQYQLKSKTLSYKDYLTFVDLANSFSRRQGTLEGVQSANISRALSWGSEASRGPATLASQSIICMPKNKKNGTGLASKDLTEMSKRLPSVLAAEAAIQSTISQKRIVELGDDISLKPFLEAGYSQTPQATRGFYAATIGLALLWNLGGEKGETAQAAATLDQQAAQENFERAIAASQSQIATLQVQVTSQLNLMTILDRSITNSDILLKTLRAQKRIGATDALGFANAYINMIDGVHSRLDTWGLVKKAQNELNTYYKYNDKDN
jgi:hypothetical protein